MLEWKHGAVCSWNGVAPDGDEIVTCGKLASEYIEDRAGRRWYACTEHLAQVRARAGVPESIHHIRSSPPALISA